MLLSFFTPTHKPIYLLELYASLTNQVGDVPFEWIIVPNGECHSCDLPPQLHDDNRIRIIESDLQGIGALKKFACDQCSGDVFVEMDHDDTLLPNAFMELAKAHTAEPMGFYYSDFINLRANGTCETYGPSFGWESYKVVVQGDPGCPNNNYIACSAFEPTARSLCQIFFAPNHVRAWSRQAYLASGGHDPLLSVGDDHDLLCRTYIEGVPFLHINSPLYVYRRWKEQSFVKHNKQIQMQQTENCNKYLHKLIDAECRRKRLVQVDFGHFEYCEANHRSYDIVKNNFWPASFKDSSIGCVRAIDCLQRIPRTEIVNVMNDVYRILRPGGWLITSTPSIDDGNGKVGRGAFQDPSHCSYWSSNNFWSFTKKDHAYLLPDYNGRFQAVRNWTHYPSEWHQQNVIPYVSADLCALKGQRQPGEQHI